jgi:hypothetical protein
MPSGWWRSVSLVMLAAGPAAGAPTTSEPTTSDLAPPPLVLTVSPGTGGGPWKLKIENNGESPVRLAADPRVLTFELTPSGEVDPKAKKKPGQTTTIKCALPADARPSNDEGRELVVPAKRSWSASFDPFFYCFGEKERRALVTGTTARARFGWEPPKAAAKGRKAATPSPPFVAVPVGAAIGKVAPVKQLESAPFTLTEPAMAAPNPTPPASGESPTPFSLTMRDAVDAAKGSELGATVTLANGGDRSVTVFFRPEVLLFTVNGPAGSVSCGTARQVGSPIPELFSTVKPNGKTTLSILVDRICPPDTFAEPGIYRVTPRLDTRGASGRSLGIRSWDGEATGKAPLLLRVRSPLRPTAPTRPSLD